MKNYFREIKFRKNNYINNPTDKRIVLFERGHKYNNDWKVFTCGENFTIQEKRVVLKPKENPENKN